jgi:hypothetical protein
LISSSNLLSSLFNKRLNLFAKSERGTLDGPNLSIELFLKENSIYVSVKIENEVFNIMILQKN